MRLTRLQVLARLKRDPLAFPGMRVGLFGGSFDPAHDGHLHVARTGLKRLGLDAVWWLVTPQNPLKPQSAPLEERLAGARALARGRMRVLDLESRWGLRYSVDTVAALQRRYPGVRFVFLVGEDAMGSLNRWRRWRDLVRRIPLAVVTRPGGDLRIRRSPSFARLAPRQVAPQRLFLARPPAWSLLIDRENSSSSSEIRAKLRNAASKL